MYKVHHLYINEKISSDGFGRNYRPTEDRLAQMGNKIQKIQSKAHSLNHRWKNLNFQEQRQIVETITEKIVIHEDAILRRG